MKRATFMGLMILGFLSFLGSHLTSVGSAYGQWHLDYEWQHLHLRSAAQKDEGMTGGEGYRMIVDVTYAPSNPDILFLVSDTAQVWKSSDGGASWEPKHNGFPANSGISILLALE